MNDQRDQAVPWATGLAVAGFVAAVIAVAVVVLSLAAVGVAGAWLALLALTLGDG